MNDFSIELSFSSAATLADEPENYLQEIDGSILACRETESSERIGGFRLYYADLDSATEAGFHPHDILDLRGETEPYWSIFFDEETQRLKDSLFDFPMNNNLLIIDRLVIIPVFRGRGIGLATLYRCIQRYGHMNTATVLKAFPLQFESAREIGSEGPTELNRFKGTIRECATTLRRYYRRLGFKTIRGTSFMYLDPALRRPSLDDLGLGGI